MARPKSVGADRLRVKESRVRGVEEGEGVRKIRGVQASSRVNRAVRARAQSHKKNGRKVKEGRGEVQIPGVRERGAKVTDRG